MSLLTNFAQVTGCMDVAIGRRLLTKHNMHLNNAVDEYFSSPQLQQTAAPQRNGGIYNSPQVIDALFSKYADTSDPNIMDLEGTISYFGDMNIDVESDAEAILAAYLLESPSTGVFLREKFVRNWSNINTATIATIEDMAKYLHDAKSDSKLFNEAHKFAFKYALEDGQRKLELEDAISLWKVLYQDEFRKFAETGTPTTATKFVNDFIEAGNSGKTQISRDEWEMSAPFFAIPLSELEKHSETAAWPVLMDDFVDFLFDRV
jgi:hypothetical protein